MTVNLKKKKIKKNNLSGGGRQRIELFCCFLYPNQTYSLHNLILSFPNIILTMTWTFPHYAN